MKTIEIRMQEIFDELSNVTNINSGGCLYACFTVYKVLKKERYDISKLEIKQFSGYWNGDSNIENNKLFIEGKTMRANSDSHFGITIDGGLSIFDSDGEVDEYKYQGSFTIPNRLIKKFCESALSIDQWNDSFNRDRWIPWINKKFGIRLSTYGL